ncbi:hypothetical protein BK131_19990 [Paenibacillus amylolyticus]|uniref:Uncharacterized protein n=1 Tax=Paenibacillus amylolyticus TaxID=1451 RepID=A0A1R1BPL4_PAEAM|nr:hypothetical protein [Paenibacillus amylolyticus]OMF11758.1 hypothetical protein BK131_19990 [Paenibacillus amylolyticus]
MTRNWKRTAYVLFFVLVALFLIRSCGPQDIDTILSEEGIPPEQVKLVTTIETRTQLVLYQDLTTNNLTPALIQQKMWFTELARIGGGLQDNQAEPLTSHISGYEESKGKMIYIIYGYLHDADITQLHIRYEPKPVSSQVEAKIVEPSPDQSSGRLWYAVIQQPIHEMIWDIKGLNDEGHVIYSSLDSEVRR